MCKQPWQVRFGVVWYSWLRHVPLRQAWSVEVCHGVSRSVKVAYGNARFGRLGVLRHGGMRWVRARYGRHGEDGSGNVWFAKARCDSLRFGKAGELRFVEVV